MSEQFHEVLGATIDHLQALKMRGAQFVALEPETMRALNGVAHRNGGSVKSPPALVVEPRTTVPAPQPPALPVPQIAPALNVAPATPGLPKTEAMTELRERALQCVKCPKLVSTRTNVVFGVGNID